MIITPPRPSLTPSLTQRDHISGPPDAPVTVVVFGDYQCPHCKAAHDAIWKILQSGEPRIRLAWRHFPLSKMHPLARSAAMAAETADAYGKFWPMHELLFRSQPLLEVEHLQQYARDLEIDPQRLRVEIEQSTHANRIQEDLSSGVRSGVNSTPTFYLNGRRHNGTYTFDVLLAAIAQEMQSPQGLNSGMAAL